MGEIGTRPSVYPEWASGGSADIVEPSAAKKLLGWVGLEIPPNEWMNWLQNKLAAWIQYIDAGHIRAFDKLQDPIGLLNDMDVCVVKERNFNTPLDVVSQSGPGETGTNPHVVECDGQYVYYGSNANLYCYDRDGTKVWGPVAMSLGPIRSISCDGNILVVAHDNFVRKCDRSDGSQDWIYDHNAAVHAVYTDGTAVFLCGAQDPIDLTNVKRLNTLGAKTADVLTTNNHTMRAITRDGEYLWVAGDTDGTNNDANVWRLNDSSLALIVSWKYGGSGAGQVRNAHDLCWTEDALIIAGEESPVVPNGNVEAINKEACDTLLWRARQHGVGTPIIYSVTYDGAYLYMLGERGTGLSALGTPDAVLRVIDPKNGQFIDGWDNAVLTFDKVRADAIGIWCPHQVSSGNNFTRIESMARASMFIVVDPAVSIRHRWPFHQLILPFGDR